MLAIVRDKTADHATIVHVIREGEDPDDVLAAFMAAQAENPPPGAAGGFHNMMAWRLEIAQVPDGSEDGDRVAGVA